MGDGRWSNPQLEQSLVLRLHEGGWRNHKLDEDVLAEPTIELLLRARPWRAKFMADQLLFELISNDSDSPEPRFAIRMLKKYAKDNGDVMGELKKELVRQLNNAWSPDQRINAASHLADLGDNNGWILNALIKEREWGRYELDETFEALRKLHSKQYANYPVIQFLLNKMQSKYIAVSKDWKKIDEAIDAAKTLSYVSPNYPHVRAAIEKLKGLEKLTRYENEYIEKALARLSKPIDQRK